MKKKKERLDKMIVNLGLSDTRTKAQALIMSGSVYIEGNKIDKSGTMVDLNSRIEVKSRQKEWVSRGAYKLLGGLKTFPVNPMDKVCIDMGASTGGFTDVLLSRGAKVVYSVDVGYGQLHWKLRNNPGVIVMERTNGRYVEPSDFDFQPELGVMDASFISITLLLPALGKILSENGQMICLVKPQFEAGRGRVGKGGVVKSPEIHLDVLKSLSEFVKDKTPFGLMGCTFSPIKGPKGNIEFLFYLIKGEESIEIDFSEVVRKVHEGEELDLQ